MTNSTTTTNAESKKSFFSKFSLPATLIVLFIAVFSFASCKKAIETFNMIGTWEVANYSENGVDKTTAFKNTFVNYRIKFDASLNYIETSTVAGVDITNGGPWKIQDGGGAIELTNLSDSTTRVLNLIDVKRNSATITETNGGKEFNLRKL